ncbi:MAG TPA: helix-turn-helix domain-containing protein [Bryobacteraceae bacterium]|nr:helix-turn-helix domain-containing protein [Bryobacteraceae bacterium]
MQTHAPTTIHPVPTRQPGQVRRTQVIEAAIRLFASRGFQGTTTKQIAEAAGVNEALIFRYFNTKLELYSAIIDHVSEHLSVERWIAEMTPLAQGRDDAALFSSLARKIIENYEGKREVYQLTLYSALDGHELARMFRERQTAPLEKFLEEYVLERQREGAFGECDALAMIRGFLCMCKHHAMLKVLFGDEYNGLTDEQAVTNFTHLFLDGARIRKARS